MDSFDNFQYDSASSYGGLGVVDDTSSVYTANTSARISVDLESLSISDRTITSKFFQHLIFDDKAENTSIIPRLSELSLRAGYEGFDASGLVKMVSSRWMPRRGIRTAVDVDCLQSVEVRLGGDVANELPNEFLALESLKAAGLQVIASVERLERW